MLPLSLGPFVSVCENTPRRSSKHADTLVLPGEASAQTPRGAAAVTHTAGPPSRLQRNPGQQLLPEARGRGRLLANAFLFESAHSYFKSGVGLALGHYRVSSLAFAPIAEKQVR